MAVDRNGLTIAANDPYVICGRVLRVDGDNVVVLTGLNNEHTLRVRAADVVRADGLGPIFGTPAGSLSAPTLPGHYVRGTELTASQSAQDALVLLLLSGYLPLSAVTVYTLTFLAAANAAAARTTLGAAAASHGHPAEQISVEKSDFSGALSSFTGGNLRELLIHIDATFPPP
jgi:hypothetical protein